MSVSVRKPHFIVSCQLGKPSLLLCRPVRQCTPRSPAPATACCRGIARPVFVFWIGENKKMATWASPPSPLASSLPPGPDLCRPHVQISCHQQSCSCGYRVFEVLGNKVLPNLPLSFSYFLSPAELLRLLPPCCFFFLLP